MKSARDKGAHAGFTQSTVIQDRSTGAMTHTERVLAEILAVVLRVDQLSADSHFFDELGADSLVMARFCARVRKRGDLPSISMQDVYHHPTIRSLGAALYLASPPAGRLGATAALGAP